MHSRRFHSRCRRRRWSGISILIVCNDGNMRVDWHGIDTFRISGWHAHEFRIVNSRQNGQTSRMNAIFPTPWCAYWHNSSRKQFEGLLFDLIEFYGILCNYWICGKRCNTKMDIRKTMILCHFRTINLKSLVSLSYWQLHGTSHFELLTLATYNPISLAHNFRLK